MKGRGYGGTPRSGCPNTGRRALRAALMAEPYQRGQALFAVLTGLLGVLVGALLVWAVVSRHPGGQGGTVAPAGTSRPVTTSSEDAIVKAVEKVGPAVVRISTLYPPPDENPMQKMLREFMGRPVQPLPSEGEGSGIIIDGKQGYVLTNAHVVRGAAKVRVTLADKRSFDARVAGSDPLSDIAVMQIRGGNLPAAALGSAARVPIGAWVIAIGNPFGLGNSVTVGVLSAKEREIRDPASGAMLQDLLQTDASINRGNSGGALVDLTGDVIGIPTAMIPQAQGLGFAVSIDSVKQVFEKIIETGKAPAWLGISYSFLTPGQARRLDVSGGRGALVQNVEADGPAGRGGIRRGDVILAIDGKAVDSEQALSKMIRAHNTGDRVTLTIWRLGQRVELRITL